MSCPKKLLTPPLNSAHVILRQAAARRALRDMACLAPGLMMFRTVLMYASHVASMSKVIFPASLMEAYFMQLADSHGAPSSITLTCTSTRKLVPSTETLHRQEYY